jgi:hypothetical protein
MCMNKTYSTVHADSTSITQNVLKQGDVSPTLLFILLYNMPLGKSQKNQKGLKLNGTYKELLI